LVCYTPSAGNGVVASAVGGVVIESEIQSAIAVVNNDCGPQCTIDVLYNGIATQIEWTCRADQGDQWSKDVIGRDDLLAG
jgi:hypothetical protein